ncbi:hypothetical protein [Hallella multisaccharivorax]|uniref:hypothetical protein n=1 Tax=Hallella multisaccharivorax TaxID=310514 RepID=UPI00360C3AA0
MTSQTFSSRRDTSLLRAVLAVFLMVVSTLSLHAQQEQPTLEQRLAGLKRLEAMQPDSIGPKYQQGMLILSEVVTHPADQRAASLLEESQRVISRIEALPLKAPSAQSDLATLKGFYYTCLIVTNPQQNGQRYYRDALDNFALALRLNPNNETARQLQAQFMEGMNKAMTGKH